jgi:hypothetical protein
LDRANTQGDTEMCREALLACTSGLRLGLLSEGDVVAASVASAERLRGEIDQWAIPELLRCGESLTRWLDSPGGLPNRAASGFAEVASDVVGLLEQCVDAALVGAPVQRLDALLARLEARCVVTAAARAAASDCGDPGVLEAFADDALDELDRCEDLLLRAEIEGATRQGLEALMIEMAAVIDAGEALRIDGLDAGRLADQLTGASAERSLSAMIEGLLRSVDEVRRAIEVAGAAEGVAASLSIPLSELLKRLRRCCRDRARELGGRIQVETDADAMARVSLAAAENVFAPLALFAAQAVASALQHADGAEAPRLRISAGIDADRVQFEIEDDAVDAMVAGETIQSLDARSCVEVGAPLHPYRRGYVNIVQVLVD